MTIKSTVTIFLLLLIAAAPALAQDRPAHFFGDGEVLFRDTANADHYCRFRAQMEVKGPPEFPPSLYYQRAFSYTLRDLTPTDAESCAFYNPTYDFVSLCRAFSMSTGGIAVDIPIFGIIQVYPRSAEVRAVFAANATAANFGFNASTIGYRLNRLADGGLEVFAYVR